MEKTIHILISYTMFVLMLLLFHKGRKHPHSRMLAFYAFLEVVSNAIVSFNMSGGNEGFDRLPVMHFIYKPIFCLWVPMFYFYVRYCFSSNFRLTKKHWIHFIPFFSFLILFFSIWISKGSHYIWENLYKQSSFLYNTTLAVDVMVKIQYLIYVSLMVRLLFVTEHKLKENPKVSHSITVDIKWLRFIVYGYAFACFTGIVYSVFYFAGSPLASGINVFSVSYFFLFFFAIFYNAIMHSSYPNESKLKTVVSPSSELLALMSKIDGLVVEKQLFLEPELSLQDIAVRLNEKERNISQAINTIKNRNLNDYINAYRIEHACKLLLTHRDKPVFEVMYESGFNTKGAFNLSFKKATGKTPTQYREG